MKIGDAVLFQGDCLTVMPSLESVDDVISDPPYEAHMHAAKRDLLAHGKQQRMRSDGSRNPTPVDFSSIDGVREPAVAGIARLCRRWALIFCTPEGVAAWRDAIEAAGGRYKRACHWVKPDSAPQFNGQGPAMGAEMFVAAWFGKGHSRWNGGGRRNVFTHLCQPPNRTGLHPTEKPLALMCELVDLFTDPGGVVLDPFMGSGTTGVACLRLGRRFIGIEQDPRYFAAAVQRIEAESRQPDMFRRQPPKMRQVGMPLLGKGGG